MSANIVALQPEHLPAALRLWQETPGIKLSADDELAALCRYLERNPRLSSVAIDPQDEQHVVGTVLCGHDGRRGYLHHVAVAASHRRGGIARALVARCLAELAQCQIHVCHAFVVRTNPYADLFWNRLGWDQRNDVHVYTGKAGE